MKIGSYRGTRDFYPEEMAVRNWLVDVWRRVSLRHGFVEYDGPTLEMLELYTAKSGQEIVDQLFNLTDRGGRALALRPEMTPTLARMVNARAGSLPRPIKWFCVPRCYRAERPQRGRLREFFQWNLDVVGTDDVLGDVECILASIDCLRELGLTAEDVVVKISDRRLVGGIFELLGLPGDKYEAAFAAVDKATRLPPEALAELWADSVGSAVPFADLEPLLAIQSRDALRQSDWSVLSAPAVANHVKEVDRLFELLASCGVGDYCDFDARIVRGFAYYTGPVYEAFDRRQSLRAVLGGGRYDNLLSVLGGPKMSGTGMGMGDVVILEVLNELGRVPRLDRTIDLFLVDADRELFDQVLQTASQLRQKGLACEFSYKRQAVGKQLSAAAGMGAKRCVIFGDETRSGGAVTVKDLATQKQKQIALSDFMRDPMQPVD